MKPHTSRATAMLYLAALQLQRKKLGFAQVRVEIPEAARSGILFIHELRPLLAEANFVHPVADSNRREQHCQWKQRNGPRRFAKHGASNAENIGADLGQVAVFAMN